MVITIENNMNRITKKEKITKNILFIIKIFLIISTVIFPIVMNLLSGIGWISTYTKYGAEFTAMGIVLLISSALMTVALILCLLKFNISAVLLQCVGFTAAMVALVKMMNYADEGGWIHHSTMQPASDIFRNHIMPTLIPFVLLVAVASLQYFAYDQKVKRRLKREEKEKKKNLTAPKILDD